MLSYAVGPTASIPAWLNTIEGAVVLLVGTLAAGTVARARTTNEWARAAILTFAGLVVVAIAVFAYAVSREAPR